MNDLLSKGTPPNSMKPYQCTHCENEVEISTNHYGECYPYCKVCKDYTPHKYTGEVPEDGWVPPPWNADMQNWAAKMREENKNDSDTITQGGD